jgi:hypothetical protein
MAMAGRSLSKTAPVLHDAAGAAFVLFELSTPFVYMRWFLFKTKVSQACRES